MNIYVSVAISAITSAIIASGAVLTAVEGDYTMKILIISVVTGLIAAARDVQKNLSQPPK